LEKDMPLIVSSLKPGVQSPEKQLSLKLKDRRRACLAFISAKVCFIRKFEKCAFMYSSFVLRGARVVPPLRLSQPLKLPGLTHGKGYDGAKAR
jgi:hypothetical protein